MEDRATRDYASRCGVEPEGLDLVAMRHTVARLVTFGGGGAEQSVGAVVGFSACDFVIFPKAADNALLGAVLRLYAITPYGRELIAASTVRRLDRPARVSAMGRGNTSWEAVIVMPSSTAQVAERSALISSYAHPGTPYDRAASGMVNALGPTINFSTGQDSLAIAGTNGAKVQALWGYNRNAAQRYLQLFDATGLPANNTVPLLSIDVAAGAAFNLVLTDPADPPPSGLGVSLGIVWGVSSTEGVLTAAGGPFTVHTRYQI